MNLQVVKLNFKTLFTVIVLKNQELLINQQDVETNFLARKIHF